MHIQSIKQFYELICNKLYKLYGWLFLLLLHNPLQLDHISQNASQSCLAAPNYY